MRLNIYSVILAALELAHLSITSQAFSSSRDNVYDISSRDLGFEPLGEHYTRELYPLDFSNISTRELVRELERRIVTSGSPPPSTGPGKTDGGNVGKPSADGIGTTEKTNNAPTDNTGKAGPAPKPNGGNKPPQTVEQLNEALKRLKSGKGAQTDKKKEQEQNLRAKIQELGGVPYDKVAAGGAGAAGAVAGKTNQPDAAVGKTNQPGAPVGKTNQAGAPVGKTNQPGGAAGKAGAAVPLPPADYFV